MTAYDVVKNVLAVIGAWTVVSFVFLAVLAAGVHPRRRSRRAAP